MTQTFIIAFIVSFLGSIPPGSINLSVLQLTLEGRADAAIRFSIAAVLIEVPYALLAVKFQILLERSPWLTENFKLIAAIVLFILGTANLLSQGGKKNLGLFERIWDSGFRKGILLGILNPMSIPFWIAVTAYLIQHDWVNLTASGSSAWYVLGLASGTMSFLIILMALARKVAPLFRSSKQLQKMPGAAFIILGFYSLGEYFQLF